MKRGILLGLGVVLALVGVLWTLQGSGVITGSGMSGQRLWFLLGLVALVVGLLMILSGARRRQARKVR